MNRRVILRCPIEERCIVSPDDNHWQGPRIGQDSVDHVKDFAIDEAEFIPVTMGAPHLLGKLRNQLVICSFFEPRPQHENSYGNMARPLG